MEYHKAKASIVDFSNLMIRNRKLVYNLLDFANLWQDDDASCY